MRCVCVRSSKDANGQGREISARYRYVGAGTTGVKYKCDTSDKCERDEAEDGVPFSTEKGDRLVMYEGPWPEAVQKEMEKPVLGCVRRTGLI